MEIGTWNFSELIRARVLDEMRKYRIWMADQQIAEVLRRNQRASNESFFYLGSNVYRCFVFFLLVFIYFSDSFYLFLLYYNLELPAGGKRLIYFLI